MVLLLDDFHLVTGNSNFPLEFFSYLRSLANNYNLAYVTTSFLELQKLCVIKDIEESPLFNIFTNLSLGPLCRGEGIRLLAAVTGREQEMVKRVAEWCGTSPNLLKLIGRKIADTKGLSDLSNLNCEEVLLPAISPYFEQILSILPQALLPLVLMILPSWASIMGKGRSLWVWIICLPWMSPIFSKYSVEPTISVKRRATCLE
ncbi:hypothetical protein ES703_81078 [subsurface metagenome]